jgi:FkbM family methyltransferase
MRLERISGHSFIPGLLPDHAIILDLGANCGAFSRTISQRYGHTCHSIEPNPEMWKRIEISALVKTHNLAVAEQDGPVHLRISGNSESSSIFPLTSEPSAPVVEVEGLTLASLVNRLKLPQIDLLKVDVEGAEVGLFRACDDQLLKSIPQISVEFHELAGLTDRREMADLFARMRRLGFDVIKMSFSHFADVLFLNSTLTGISRTRVKLLRHIDRNIAIFGRLLKHYHLR